MVTTIIIIMVMGGNNNDNSGVPTLPLISPPVSPPTLRNSTEATSDDDDEGEGGGMNNQITMSNDTDDAVVDDMLNQALAVAGVTVLPTKSSLSQDDGSDNIDVYEDQTALLEEEDSNDDNNGGETAAATDGGAEMVEQMGVAKKVEEEEESSSQGKEEEEDDDEIQEIDPPTAVSDGEINKPPTPIQDSESIEDENVKKEQIDDDDDGKENEEDDDKKPIVGAMAVGAIAAGGAAAAAAAAAASKSPVEPTTGEIEDGEGIQRGLVEELDVDGGPPIPFEDDVIVEKGDDVSGEHFDLSDKEFQKQVVPMIPSRDSSLQRNSSVRVWSPYNDEDGLQINQPDYDTSQQQRSAAPKFFPIEAKPVAEKEDHPSHNSQQGASSGPVYTAERVYEESCWKRHRRCICLMVPFFLLLIAVVVLVVLFLLGPMDWRQPASTSTEAQFCEVINLGPFYQSECEFCTHTTGMDPKTGIIWRDSKEGDGMVQFIPNTGTYIPGQNFPYLFHEEVAILGNYAALGDRWMGNGTVYMYEKDDSGVWSNIMNITPETLHSEGDFGGAEFGTSIAFDGDRMVVGAPWDTNEGGNTVGSVYFYQLQNDGAWVEEAKLYQNSTLGVGASFGFAVALKGDTLVVGGGYDSKHAFVYKFDSTSNEWKQPPVNGTLSSEDCEDRFGYSVGVTDNGGILVECPMEKSGSGAVYYYIPSSDGGYKLSQKITTFNNEPLPELGEKIIVNNDFLLLTTDAEMVNGTAYIFQNSGGKWKEAAFVDAPAGAPAFGIDAAFVGEHLFLAYWGNIYSYILQCAN